MIPDEMVDAAFRTYCRSTLPTARQSMRAALEAAGVGELIEALDILLSATKIDMDSIHARCHARTVLEKMGVKL